jgi:hypothetical protein
MKNLLFVLFTALTIFAQHLLALSAPAPLNNIKCSAGVFSPGARIPTEDLQPFQFSLPSNKIVVSWSSKIETIILKDRYKPFYSTAWISPETLSPFSSKALVSRSPVQNEGVTFTLTRFPESDNRVAGISLEVNVAKGFYAAYLVDFKNNGYSKKIMSPFKIENDDFLLTVSCDVDPLP